MMFSSGDVLYFLADPGKARGCSRNTSVTDSLIQWFSFFLPQLFSRPRQSQGLFYKPLHHWFINSVSQPFPPTALWHRHTQTVKDSTSSYKIDYGIVIENFLNPEGHQNPFNGSKVWAILLKGWIWLIGGVESGRVCACSLRRRLVNKHT